MIQQYVLDRRFTVVVWLCKAKLVLLTLTWFLFCILPDAIHHCMIFNYAKGGNSVLFFSYVLVYFFMLKKKGENVVTNYQSFI